MYSDLPDSPMNTVVKVYGEEGDDVLNAMNDGMATAGFYYGG